MDASATLPDTGLLRFITCGSVDDGKSTLIGRLLLDTRSILADAMSALERTSQRRGHGELDLSLLTDGLLAEREQGITIDVAYRYFSTGTRKYILGDTPGHEQYTRNMVTAASTAELAVILVDARKGILAQTRRHAVLASLMGIRQFVIAVNKMDLVGWSEEVFEGIKAAFLAFARDRGLQGLQFVPICAVRGDSVVAPGPHMPWYEGPPLLEMLEKAPLTQARPDLPFRMPIQWVCPPGPGTGRDGRGYAGRVEAGEVEVGEAITAQPSGHSGRIREIRLGPDGLDRARAGQSVMLFLDGAFDLGRGDLLASPAFPPTVGTRVDARICWLGDRPGRTGDRFLMRHGTREVRAHLQEIGGRLDFHTLAMVPAHQIAMNDLADVELRLQAPIAADRHERHGAAGAFILIDEKSNETVAGGLILETRG